MRKTRRRSSVVQKEPRTVTKRKEQLKVKDNEIKSNFKKKNFLPENDFESLNEKIKPKELKKLISESKTKKIVENEKENLILKKKYEIEKLKEEIKEIESPSYKEFKKLESKQIDKKFNKKTKEELIKISSQLGIDHDINDGKKEIIGSIKKLQSDIKLDNKIKKKRTKEDIPVFSIDKIKELNKERIEIASVKHKICFDYINEKVEGKKFVLFKTVHGIEDFQTLFIQNACLFYCNGWNQEIVSEIISNNLEEDFLKELSQNLPHRSLKFESIILPILKGLKLEISETEPLFTKWTRKCFCLNLGCKQNYSRCDFIIKYKVYYIKKFNCFKYEVYIKGGHDNYLIGEGLKNSKSVFAKSVVNHFVKEGLKNKDISNKLYDISKPFLNPFTKDLLLFERKKINGKRYYQKKVENGIYEDCFRKAYEFFKKKQFSNLRMVKFDEKNLTIIFINNSIENYDLKKINQAYIDGTFKTKFWLNSHYNLLAIAVNLPGSLNTIPLIISIGFKGRSIEYLNAWKILRILLIKVNVNVDQINLISDVGSSEIAASKKMEIKFSFYCWFHVLNKIFIPKLDEVLKEDKYLIELIIKNIRFVYCSKTFEQLSERVKCLKEIISNKKGLEGIFEGYLTTESLMKWTSVLKITQYAEHTSNYLERFFGTITNKNLAKQSKLIQFVKEINSSLKNIDISHCNKNESNRKMTKCNEELQKGVFLYLESDITEYEYLLFKVPSNNKEYLVDLKNWACDCLSFNYSCYTCKHMFAVIIQKCVELNFIKNIKDIKKIKNPFSFLKEMRKRITNNEELKKMIDFQDFPVTISENVFNKHYKKN